MSGYAFHPDAFADLDEMWEYIAQDSVDAADRVLADIHSTHTGEFLRNLEMNIHR